MQVNVVKIGNSKGIRIPKKILDQCQVSDVLELTVQDNEIVLRPIHKKPREGWAKAAKHCHELGDDALLITDVLDDDEVWQ
ncbi:MAG: AbrB/MazE/SpoVT family DNA-binding domain-containing protein, partial [Mariprofundaceae bacterium]|nr:AbrB/MazE/SpoVT family DNA-binding domain-containing protein [Mariprofundaceae bacterium]